MAEIDEGADIALTFAYKPGQKMLAATSDGRGFIVNQDDMVGNTRKGKVVMNPDAGVKVAVLAPAEGDHVAIIGENRKLLVFSAADVPEMARGKGVRLQRYKDGGVADAKMFAIADGLTWTDSAGRNFTVAKPELNDWIGNRADAGRLPPKGFPKNNKFSG
jgi:topoisomerase-4 subunit A